MFAETIFNSLQSVSLQSSTRYSTLNPTRVPNRFPREANSPSLVLILISSQENHSPQFCPKSLSLHSKVNRLKHCPISISDFTTMAKKHVSVALHKKKPIKTIEESRRTLFKKMSKYMKKNVYMFSLLTSPRLSRSVPSASSGEGSIIRMEKGNSWLREVEEYLKCDFHMYAPLCYDSASVNPPKDNSRQGDPMEHRTDKIQTTRPGDITPSPTKTITVKHVLLEKETVKHIVLPYGGSSFASEDVLQKEPVKAAA